MWSVMSSAGENISPHKLQLKKPADTVHSVQWWVQRAAAASVISAAAAMKVGAPISTSGSVDTRGKAQQKHWHCHCHICFKELRLLGEILVQSWWGQYVGCTTSFTLKWPFCGDMPLVECSVKQKKLLLNLVPFLSLWNIWHWHWFRRIVHIHHPRYLTTAVNPGKLRADWTLFNFFLFNQEIYINTDTGTVQISKLFRFNQEICINSDAKTVQISKLFFIRKLK